MAGEVRASDAGGARVLVISNPARKGAVDAGMLARLQAEAQRASEEGIRAVILTGEPGAFCAGSDLSALPDTPGDELPDAPLGRACAALEECAAPVIAAIDGPAFGAGFELACACDFRLAAPSARFALPPAKLGLIYSPDGAARVVRAVGLQVARDLFLRALTLDAQQAAQAGFVELADNPLQAAQARAAEFAALAPRSIAGMKRTLRALSRTALSDDDRGDLDEERREAFASEDAREGRAAFLERRAPKWSGR